MNYRGIIIKESLTKPEVLGLVEILSQHAVDEGSADVWNMCKVQVAEEEIEDFTEKISKVLDPKISWYCHFYNEDPNDPMIYVVFFEKVFFVEKDDPHEAVEYGLSLGIAYEQLDFRPQAIADEQW